MSSVTVEEYHGNPMLVLRQYKDEQFPFKFGFRKAQLLLAHLDEIRQFVAQHQKVATR